MWPCRHATRVQKDQKPAISWERAHLGLWIRTTQVAQIRNVPLYEPNICKDLSKEVAALSRPLCLSCALHAA